jgi:(1->4)-alpha-D-glucan 1-alpha-D-glucosylmutase
LRQRYLNDIVSKLDKPVALASELLEAYPDGRVKLYVTYRALQLRQSLPELFVQGDYAPLEGGPHIVAFLRSFEEQRVVSVAPRFSQTLSPGAFPVGPVWSGQSLVGVPAGRYRELLSGRSLDVRGDVELSVLLADFPLALLTRESA